MSICNGQLVSTIPRSTRAAEPVPSTFPVLVQGQRGDCDRHYAEAAGVAGTGAYTDASMCSSLEVLLHCSGTASEYASNM